MTRLIRNSSRLMFVAVCVLAAKHFYSAASADQLRWILAPTTAMVELLSGQRFYFESRVGYMDESHRFLIANSCSGVNFLIASFVMLSVGWIQKDRFQSCRWLLFPCAGALAFVGTIGANSTRILLALKLQEAGVQAGWMDPSRVHRLEGILVYFGFLLLIFFIGEIPVQTKRDVSWRMLVFPLAVYEVMALGVPMLNGAFLRPLFWEHFAFVITVPALVVFAAIVLSSNHRVTESQR